MKSIPELISSIRGNASLLSELAADLEELANFFSGVPAPAPPPALKTKPKERDRSRKNPIAGKIGRPRKLHPAAEAIITAATPVVEAAPPPPEPPAKKRIAAGNENNRPIAPDERRAIREEFFALPEEQRTTETRHALALKHQCAFSQIFGLTRPQEVYDKMVANRYVKAATRGS